MRVLLLGATGATGRRAAAELARMPEVARLEVSGRTAPSVENLARVLGGDGERIVGRVIDVTRPGAVSGASADIDVVVSCAGPAADVELPAVRAAIDAGVPYASLCDDAEAAAEVLALDDKARAAGVAVVTGAGLSPGVTNWLVDIAARQLDEVTEIEISVGASAVDASGESWLLHVARAIAPETRTAAPPSARGSSAPKLVYFPEPVGWVETFSGVHPEAVTLAIRHPQIRSIRYTLGLTEKALMDAVRASNAVGLGARRATWLRAARVARPILRQFPPRKPVWSAARVDVRGTDAGRVASISYGVVDRLANLASIPLTITARHLAGGRVEPGTHAAAGAIPASEALRALAVRGIRVARLEPQPV